MPQQDLQGRVFQRLQRFAALPLDFQEDVKQFQAFVERHKHILFANNYHALITSVYSVKSEALVTAIMQWIQAQVTQSGQLDHTTTTADTANEDLHAEASVPTAPVSFGTAESTREASELLIRAKMIAQALVLSGFLTPCNDTTTDATACLKDNELLIPVAENVTQLHTTSVWSVVDGATYARLLKRKAGVFTNSKSVYVVLNDTTKKAYLFESDVAREPIAEMHGESVTVLCDSYRFEFGVRVAIHSLDAKDRVELIDAGSKSAQEEFVSAWLAIGAQYYENNVDETAEANARGLVGPEASHNAKWNLTTPALHNISTANIAAAYLSGVTPMEHYASSGSSGGDDHQAKNIAPAGSQTGAHAPPIDPRWLPSVAGSGLGALRLPLGWLVDKAFKSFVDQIPFDVRLIAAFQFLATPYYIYERRKEKGPEMTEGNYLE